MLSLSGSCKDYVPHLSSTSIVTPGLVSLLRRRRHRVPSLHDVSIDDLMKADVNAVSSIILPFQSPSRLDRQATATTTAADISERIKFLLRHDTSDGTGCDTDAPMDDGSERSRRNHQGGADIDA